MRLSAHFTLEEFTRSDTAERLHIDNTPTEEHVAHLRELVQSILGPLRKAWGSAITISSGYRSPKLNAKIGGAKRSAHATGYAADLVPANGQIREFKAFVLQWLRSNPDIHFDQYIDERNTRGSEWVLIGCRYTDGSQRRQYLKTTNGKVYSHIK